MTHIDEATKEAIKSRIDLRELVARYTTLEKTGRETMAGPCPKCGGDDRFTVYPNRCGCRKCHGEGVDKMKYLDVFGFIQWVEGVDFQEAVSQLSDGAVTTRPASNGSGAQRRQPAKKQKTQKPKGKTDFSNPLKVYDYPTADGQKHLQVLRLPVRDKKGNVIDKDFRAKHWDGRKWEWGKGDKDPVLYRQQELIAADPTRPVWLPAGEKDVDKLREYGQVATTNPFGEEYWDEVFNQCFAGRQVIIPADNDEPGARFATTKATALYGTAATLKLMTPHLGGWHKIPKGDISDVIGQWEAEGLSAMEITQRLNNLVGNTPEWSPPQPEPEDVKIRTTWDAAELLAAQFPEPEWIIPDLLPLGVLAVLAGRPKLGKSWLSLQWALAAGRGAPIFDRRAKRAKVLYIALEDNARRIQGRMKDQLAHDPFGYPAGALTFRFNWPDLRAGGLGNLEIAIAEDGYQFVIIDTLSRAAKFRQREVEEATEVVGGLQRLALEFGATILLIEHHRKQASDVTDVIDDVSGSTGKTATADTILGLYRKRMETVATLKATGRDQDETEVALRWDKERYIWEYLGAADEVAKTEGRQEILDALHDFQGKAPVTKLADYLGKDKGYISRELARMEVEGLVQQPEYRGAYQVAHYNEIYQQQGQLSQQGQQGQLSQQGQQAQQRPQTTENDRNSASFVDQVDGGQHDESGQNSPIQTDFIPEEPEKGVNNYYAD